MKEIFETTYAKCAICGTPTSGEYKIGSEYYCAEHAQKESIEEKISTENMLKANKKARDFLEKIE